MPANAVPSVALDAVSPEAARERILDAAVALFAVSGYEGTAVRAIVQRAGTNLNSVNYYFGGKLGLYRAVMQRELARAASFTAHLPKPAAKSAVWCGSKRSSCVCSPCSSRPIRSCRVWPRSKW